ncbi:MAG: transcription antitermination factor NusB [Candidatus Nanopelagicales bacterium]|nr:transcription antitermination factor NusB [Candidatus Nanopelagicales bacterium]
MSADPAREAALELLRVVRDDDAYANLALPGILHQRRLSGRDAAFATELAFGALRWRGLYDAILGQCVSRSWAEVDASMQDVLRIGAHQVLGMRVPAHAAVDSTCNLARLAGSPGGAKARAGFVNAVLRKVALRDVEAWVVQLGADGATEQQLAVRWSHPAWIVRALAQALGDRRDELGALLEADNVPARPTLVARPGRMSAEELLAIPGVEPARWSPFAATLVDGIPSAIDEVRSGAVGVQDEGSQLVALALTRVPVTSSTHRWLDMCAGPGGKAALLDGLAAADQAQLIAVEQHAHRAHLVRQALGEHSTAQVVVGDATGQQFAGDFDRVLADVPCTGLGALRRRPEARWRRLPSDVAGLAQLQRALLEAAVRAAAPGGVIAYVTCSPHFAETELVVQDICKAHPELVLLDAPSFLPEVPDARRGSFVQLWPHRHGTDAMFLALLQRPAA